MSVYPIYIDSTTPGAQLSIGTVNTSYIVIGAPTTSVKNTSTVINGVRLDSNKNSSNLIITHANSAITPINGTDNTVVSDGLSLNTGSYNTAVGSGTLLSNTAASWNTAIGYNALKVTTGSANTAIGANALESNVTGQWNVAVGCKALPSSTGDSNVGVGDEVYTNLSGTSSAYNVGVGTRTCPFYTSGSYNTMIGYATNDNNTYKSGTANTCIGHATNTSNYSYSTAIGYGATCTASNQIMIGTTNQTTQIGNTRITNSGKSGSIYLSTNSKINNTAGYEADYLLTAEDSWDSTVTEGSTIYGRTVAIVAGNTSFDPTNGYRNATAYAGDIVIRGGSSKSPSDGTHAQTLRAGNVYIDGGSAWCNGGSGNSLTAVPGSIILRTGKPSTGNTYYNDQVNLMTVAQAGITTNVPMKIYEATGTTMGPKSGSLVIEHGNPGGASCIVFPSRTNDTDYAYIRYRDDQANEVAGEAGRLEIGCDNDSNDCVVLQKDGAYVGIGQSNPIYTLDISGSARVTQGLTTTGTTNINGIRIDSNSNNKNLAVTLSSNTYNVNTPSTNNSNTLVSNNAFSINMTGDHCTAVGENCLPRNTTGARNLAIGADTLEYLTEGSNNVAVGGLALQYATTASKNVAVGVGALKTMATCLHPNVAVGTDALEAFNHSGAGGNVAIGNEALKSLTSGTGNVAIGHDADKLTTTSSQTVCIGNGAKSGGFSDCIVIGEGAVASANNQIILGKTAGSHKTYIQGSEGLAVTGKVGIGTNNPTFKLDVQGGTSVGTIRIYEASGIGTINHTTDPITGLPVVTDTMTPIAGSLVIEHGNYGGGSSIVFPSKNNRTSDFGYIRYRDDVEDNGSGFERSRLEIGLENDYTDATYKDSLILQKNGGYVGIGTVNPVYNLDVTGTARVTQGLTTTGTTIISGVRIDSNTTNHNLIVTTSSNTYAVNTPSTNNCNTIVSNTAFSINSMTGHHCTAVGHYCLPRNTTGIYNVAIGADTLYSLTEGNYNVAIGGEALNKVTTTSDNVAVGVSALATVVTSLYPNVAVGTNALRYFNDSGSGANVAIGNDALYNLTSGTGNVAIGYLADNATTGSSQTICIGNQAKSGGFSHCIVIGEGAVASANNQIILGKSAGSHKTYIQGTGGLAVTGNVGIGVTNPIYKLDVAGTASFGATRIYEATGTTMGPTSGSLVIQHGNPAGQSSIVFPSTNNGTDYGYIRFRDDEYSGYGEAARLEIGCENDLADCVVLQKDAGLVGIGTTTPIYKLDVNGTGRFTNTLTGTSATFSDNVGIGTTSPGYKLDVQGQGRFTDTLTCNQLSVYASSQLWNIGEGDFVALTIQASNYPFNGVYLDRGTNSWSGWSDRRLKKNIVPMESMINKVMQLNPVTYNFIDASGDKVGFIAQEVMNYFPNFVTESGGKYGIMYTEFISVLTKCIQEEEIQIINLQKENDDLKKEQKIQQDKITSLETKLQLLESQMSTILQRLDK